MYINIFREEISQEKILDGLEMTNAKANVPTNAKQKHGNIGMREQEDGIST